jgi:hypothetical protein
MKHYMCSVVLDDHIHYTFQRITKIQICPALLSESMASLMNGSPTTSRARVQRRSSALYSRKQLRQAGAGAAGVAAAEKNFAMRSENDRLRFDAEADTSTISAMEDCRSTV